MSQSALRNLDISGLSTALVVRKVESGKGLVTTRWPFNGGAPLNRRTLLQHAAVIPLLPLFWKPFAIPASGAIATKGDFFRRVRPSDPSWPSQADWEKLSKDVGGRLVKVRSLLGDCASGSGTPCDDVLKDLRNPNYVGDDPAGTMTVGWVDAWMTAPSEGLFFVHHGVGSEAWNPDGFERLE